MEPFDAEKYIEAAAPALGLTLTPAERSAVGVQMTRINTLAQLVLDHPFTVEDELAPGFAP